MRLTQAAKIKIPEKAPNIADSMKDPKDKKLVDVALLTTSDDFKKIAKDVNKEYLYWDKFKYYPLPEGMRAESAWLALKLIRVVQGKPIPLTDTSGKRFTYWLPDVAQEALHFIDQNAGGQMLVDEPSIHKKERQHYIMNSIMEEAIASSILEGAATTRKKAREMFKTRRKPKNKAEQMIYNNYKTIRKIKNLLNRALSPELLTELQELITKGTLEKEDYEGRFRTEKDDQIAVMDSTGQILHEPPPAAEIPKQIDMLCEFVNTEDETDFIHPVIRGIVLHFWLAYLHPFMDGNGRTARALFYWYLLKKNFWLFEYLSISRIILRAPAQYYQAFLYSEIDNCDMTYFLRFHLRAIKLAIRELKKYLERKQKESVEAIRNLANHAGLNYRQRALLTHALSHPDRAYTPQSHMQAHNIVYQTARSDLLDLVKRGFLERIKEGRGFSFLPVRDLEEKIKA